MALENLIKEIMLEIGMDPNKEELKDTPTRAANFIRELTQGMHLTNDDIAKLFGKTFPAEDKNTIIIKNIDIFSLCEHHLALMYDMTVDVAYVPDQKIIGLSKIPRICQMVAKRATLQERITKDIYTILNNILDPDKLIVRVTGKHSCVTARGIKSINSFTETLQSYRLDKSIFD